MGSTSYTKEEISALCNVCAGRGIYLLHDCTYRDFAHGRHYSAVRYYDRAVMTVSLSKSCGFAGLRFGAAIARPALFEEMVEKHISRLGVNCLVQRGAIAAYASKQRWLPRILETNREHQAMIKACVDGIKGLKPVAYPSFGNFLAVDVTGTGRTAEQIVRSTLDKGIVIRSGQYTSPRFGESFVRVTTTVPTRHVTLFCEVFPQAVARVVG